MITKNLSTLKINKLSQEQYNREYKAGNIDETAMYLTPAKEIDLSGYATVDQLNGKADKTHNHEIGDVNGLQSELDKKDTVIEITRAEYEYLGDVVLTDGITYFIKDANNLSGSSLNYKIVSELPSNAASNTNTFYIVG